jgi:hypothetical protein
LQKQLLEEEGIIFRPDGSIDFDVYGWLPAESFYRRNDSMPDGSSHGLDARQPVRLWWMLAAK